ncbi:MAG: ATP-binding protein [Pontibacterium sp.]
MANHQSNLSQLNCVRLLTLFGQATAIVVAVYLMQAKINYWLVGSTLFALVLLNIATCFRLRSDWPVTEPEFFSHLLADVILYGCLLYQTGGANNPFIFVLLVPLIISAATLPIKYTLITAAPVVLIYTSLLIYYNAIVDMSAHQHHTVLSLFDLHIIAMWFSFILTAIVVVWFIFGMRRSLQEQEEKLETEREKRIHDQQLLSLATMAAGTAHELGTPLNTIKLLIEELKQDYAQDKALFEDLELMQTQVSQCSSRLKDLTRSVREEQKSHRVAPLAVVLDELLEQWEILRPEVEYQYRAQTRGDSPLIRANTSLYQSILNLLNNAADANPKGIVITTTWDDTNVTLSIHDKGSGIPLETMDTLGQPFITSKGKGLGIGLFLTATTLSRLDGSVRLYNHSQGGTLTEVTLPVATLATIEGKDNGLI